MLGTYDSAVAYADLFVGILLDEVEKNGLSDNTVIVIFGDHGEDLLAHGFFNHRFSLHDENTQVPLILLGPGIEHQVIDSPVALMDIFPTILELAKARKVQTKGKSLLHPEPERMVFSESMLGELSVRSKNKRLRIQKKDLQQKQPQQAPESWELLDEQGKQLPWTDPTNALLWSALHQEFQQ